MSKSRAFVPALLAAAFALGLSACGESEGPAEQAGEKIDEAVEEAGDAVEEAADELEAKTH